MFAENSTDCQEAITTTYQLSHEKKIRMQCEAREDYYRRTRGRERMLREAILEKEQLVSENKQLTSKIAQKNAELADKDAEIKLLRQKLAARCIDTDSIE